MIQRKTFTPTCESKIRIIRNAYNQLQANNIEHLLFCKMIEAICDIYIYVTLISSLHYLYKYCFTLLNDGVHFCSERFFFFDFVNKINV